MCIRDRENTVAARMENQIEQEVKERRAELVMHCLLYTSRCV